MAMRTNSSILDQLHIKQRLSDIYREKILKYYGYHKEKKGSLEKCILIKSIKGARYIRWMDKITAPSGQNRTSTIRTS